MPKVAKNSTSRKQNMAKEKGSAVINAPRIGQVKGETRRVYSAKKCEPNSDGNNKGNANSSTSGTSSSRSTLTDQHEDNNSKEQEGSGESEAAFQKQQQQNHSRTEMSNISLYINWLSEEEESPEATRISVENQEQQETRCCNSQKVSNLSAPNIGNKSNNSNKNNSNSKNIVNQERAEALESLLELCAKLLKREKLEELAGVLKPFEDEEEGVSSRETAIWLTKGLIDIHK